MMLEGGIDVNTQDKEGLLGCNDRRLDEVRKALDEAL